MKEFKIRCSQLWKIMSNSKKESELSDTCKIYLKEWYSGEIESVHSKFFDKGIMCEYECIEFMANVLDLGIAEKNIEQKENEFMTGCCDVNMENCIVDIKNSWNIKTLQSNVTGIDKDYEWQGIGYLILYKKLKFILFYGLMDTDESINFGEEVIYSEMPNEERWIAYQIQFTQEQLNSIEQKIYERVLECRDWLREYDKLIRSRMGKLNVLAQSSFI